MLRVLEDNENELCAQAVVSGDASLKSIEPLDPPDLLWMTEAQKCTVLVAHANQKGLPSQISLSSV